MTLLIVYVTAALAVSFLCSVMEAVLLSVTPGWLATLEERGDKAADGLRHLKADIDRPLAAILSLNTVAHTVGATGAGAQAVRVFGEAWVGVISAVLTLLILVTSEIIPKTLGAVYWRPLSRWLPRVLRPTMWAMYPLVLMSQGVTRLLSRGAVEASVSREELAALAEVGQREGALNPSETRILSNLLQLREVRVHGSMTPRVVVVSRAQSLTTGELLGDLDALRFSRLPIYDGTPDEITGYVLKSEVLLRLAHGERDVPLADLRRDIEILPESATLAAALDRLQTSGEHIALVVDEFGGTAGILTFEDVVETLLGLEIVDESDTVEDMQALARQLWQRRAMRLGLIEPGQEPGGP